ncbi:general secretion pathway protein GspD [Vibrio sp. 10N.286.49.B3]|uniref:type II and III secretion system protein family protein n=1 Tax=Vibrio sp. 10N.286.49.B3 TaxID=1880855 RepID=UPI000C839A5E|nr:type II and III secretion system protein family protein [Vibrio sp. 10N.286.49.B3]PMH46709.1 general secretion pathway protein GspD [Vibrio sp. 10N.286.49.B3]
MWQLSKYIGISLVLALFSVSSYAQRIMNLAEGDARTIALSQEMTSVFVSDPTIADYQVIDKQKVVIFGKKIGTTSLLIFNEEGKTLASRKLVVNKSMLHIQQQIQLKYPLAEVTIYNLGEQVVLSGVVSTEQEKDEINILVGELLGKSASNTEISWDGEEEAGPVAFMQRRQFQGIVNNIEVATTKQVNVKLSIAEVSHSFLEQVGFQYGSAGYSNGVFVNQLTSFSASDIISVITAIGDDTVGQVLAEPNLSVISGESASFLVGGELPVVTIVDSGTNVIYKEFGIRLDLMAKVLNDDKIKLSLMPEVSSLDTQYSNETYNLPSLKTRRARTTVELGDGQSFVLGGLLNTEDKETLQRIPFIGDIPILGALFRNSGTERSKTELIIVATVNLVQPIHPSQIQLPTMQKTTTLQRFFAVERNYTHASEKWADEVLATGGFKK